MAIKMAALWLGVPETMIEAFFGGFKRISFHFAEMRLLSCNLAGIASMLPRAEPTSALLALPDSSLYVVHEVLQAREISILNENENQSSASSSASYEAAARIAAEVGLELNAEKASHGLLVFSSERHHTIGFKAYEIALADGEYRLRAPLGSSGLTHLAEPDLKWEPVLFEEDLV